MKKGIFKLSVLLLSSFTTLSLTSCNEVSKASANIEIFDMFDFADISIKNEKEAYFAGDIVVLDVTMDDKYVLSYTTLNDVKIEDINAITLVAGDNEIHCFFTKDEEIYDQSHLRDFTFVFDEDSDSYFIKSYSFTGKAPTAVDIPSQYRNKNVSKILGKSFVSANGTKTINVPKTIPTIEESAFIGLSTLNNFNVSENNTNYTTINGVLFRKNKEHLLAYPDGKGTSYSVPTTTKYIDSYAFNSSKIIDITLNDGLLSIGDNAFEGCTGLINFVMRDIVTDLGTAAFKTCSNMKTIKLSNSLKELKD
jgi:hypothetical protein